MRKNIVSFLLGKQLTTKNPVELPIEALHRHLMALGASGSGKTVLCKCIMEEAILHNIPLIIVDPQGDISSLILKEKAEIITEWGLSLNKQEEYFRKSRISIFTPGSSKGISLSVNPLSFPSEETPYEEAILALDLTATSLSSFLGYDLNSDSGKGAKAYLFSILEYFWKKKETINDIEQLAEIVLNPPSTISKRLNSFVKKGEPKEIARKIQFFTVGTPALMFQKGIPIDIDMFMDNSDGKVPLNIIYLNTLSSTNDKQFFLATLLRELYCWMLKNPSEKIQLLFYVDEIAQYIPPYPRNPPPKEAYNLLFKQARKYGVGLIAATQNITDIDYKALAQVNTWCLGRMMTRQDIAKVKQIIKSIDPKNADLVIKKLPSLKSGEFIMLSPDVFNDAVNFQVRWLLSIHKTLDEKEISTSISSESKEFYTKFNVLKKSKRKKLNRSTCLSSPSKVLSNRIKLLLNSIRQSVSAEYIAEDLNVSVENVEKELNFLIKSKIVKKSRIQDTDKQLYWLSKFGFEPSKNIMGEILTISPRITQVEALKRAKSWLEGNYFSKKEEFYDAKFSQIPIWKVLTSRKAKHLFFFKKEEVDTFYLSATTGAMISLEKNEMVFHKLIMKSAGKFKNLDDDELIIFVPRLPKEIQKIPKIKIDREKIFLTLKLTLGVQPLASEVVLLPVWTLKIKHKKKKKKRSIVLDASTGRKLVGRYKLKRCSK